jgi:hypothetical protein
MDPSFCAYVTDNNGLLLDHSEIRSALIKGDSLVVKGGLIHNGEPYYGGQKDYLDKYMSKNLFRFRSPLNSEYGYEFSKNETQFIVLNPIAYKEEKIKYNQWVLSGDNRSFYFTHDNNLFWKKPNTN